MKELADLRTFLIGWPELWRYPNLWCAIHGHTSIESWIRAFIDDLAEPREVTQIPEYMLSRGAYDAAAALLERVDLLGNAPAVDVHYLQGDLAHRRLKAQARVLAAADELVARSDRAGGAITKEDPRLQEAYRLAIQDEVASMDLVSAVRADVEQAEGQSADRLHAELRHRLSRTDADGALLRRWKTAVERALREKHIDLARFLIETEPDGLNPYGDDGVIVPTGILPFRSKSPTEICRWLLDGQGGPPELYACWDPLRTGSEAKAALSALYDLCSSEYVTSDMAAGFLSALEQLLGYAGTDTPELRTVPGALVAGLRGLADRCCFGPVGGNVKICFPTDWDRCKTHLISCDEPFVVFRWAPHLDVDDRFVSLTPWDILQCLSRPDGFRTELLHTINAQRRLQPLPVQPADDWSITYRDVDVAAISEKLREQSQVLIGPEGAGMYACGRAVCHSFEREGWICFAVEHPAAATGADRVGGVNDTDRVMKALSEFLGTDLITAQQTSRVLLRLHNVHELYSAEIEAILRWAENKLAQRRVLFCGSASYHGILQSMFMDRSVYRLELLPVARMRSFADRALYVNGYPLTHAFVLDRIAYYAAGRPSLLYALLRSVFIELEDRALPRSAPIEIELLEHAFARNEYLETLRGTLLGPLESEPSLHVTFAASLAAFATTNDQAAGYESASLSEIEEWLNIEEVELPVSEFSLAVQSLVELRLLDMLPDSRVTLSPTGGGQLVLSIVTDRQRYLTEAKARMQNTTRGGGWHSMSA